MSLQALAAVHPARHADPPSPGSLRVRPRREDAEKDQDAFYELLEWSRCNEKFSRNELGKVLGDQSINIEAKMSRKIRDRNFDPRSQRIILEHIFDESSEYARKARARLRAEPHALYYALLNFVATQETSQDNTRAAIVGTYRFWRYSIDHPGEIVHGKLVFSEPPGSRAVTVRMQQAKRASDGSREAHSEGDGYFIKIGNAYLMLLNDPINRAFRFTIFSSFRVGWVGVGPGGDNRSDPKSVYAARRRHLVFLDGHVVGIDSNKTFLSPVHLSLVDNVDELAVLDEQLDVMPQDDPRIPRRVVQKLLHSGPLQLLQA